MTVWLLVPIAILILFVVLVLLITLKGTLYLGSAGYISGGSIPPRHVTLEQYGTVVSRLVGGEPFDFLWVSILNDDMRGLTLVETEGRVELAVTFLTDADSQNKGALSETMAQLGYAASEEDKESVTYYLPNDPAVVVEASLQSLVALQNVQPDSLYISASNIAEGRGKGIKFVPQRDLLEGII